MYKNFIKKGVFLIFLWLVLPLILVFFVYSKTGSYTYSILVIPIFLAVRYFFSGGNLKKRKNSLKETFHDYDEYSQDNPLKEDSALIEIKWLKGVGKTGDIDQPVWVRVDDSGIIVFFLAWARNPPILIPEKRIIKILFNENQSLAKIYFKKSDDTISFSIPWKDSFTKKLSGVIK